jgi:hypothetical protein
LAKSEIRGPKSEGSPKSEIRTSRALSLDPGRFWNRGRGLAAIQAILRLWPIGEEWVRFVSPKLHAKGLQFLNRGIRGIRGKALLEGFRVFRRLWFWLGQLRISDFELPSDFGFRFSDLPHAPTLAAPLQTAPVFQLGGRGGLA